MIGTAPVRSPRAQWISDGTPICTVQGRESDPIVVTDGAGGAIVVWRDRRNENTDVYAQRITNEGLAAWTASGVPVCLSFGLKSFVSAVSDGEGGAIIIWTDRRVEWDLFAQRVRSNGEMAWELDGVPVCMADDEQKYTWITTDGAGGAIIGWIDLRFGWDEYCVYVQRIDSTGSPLWDIDGVPIYHSTATLGHVLLVPDGEGGAIITWGERGNGGVELHAQRVNGFGDLMWEGESVMFSGPQVNRSATWIIEDGANGVIFTWWDKRGGYRNIYAQRIDEEGKILWRKNDTVVCAEFRNQMFPRLTQDGHGGAIIVWHDGRNTSWDIYAQRLDSRGRIKWGKGGVPVCTADGHQKHPRIVTDGAGGAYVVWSDERNGVDNLDIYGQRIDAEGMSMWRMNGEPLIAVPGDQMLPEGVPDGAHGVIFTWTDRRPGAGGVYAWRLSPKTLIEQQHN